MTPSHTHRPVRAGRVPGVVPICVKADAARCAAAELTNASAKRGRVGGLTPWELLAHFDATGETWARDRFRDYAGAFKGRHQLTYSHGLKAALGLDSVAEKTDAELVAELEHGAVWVGALSPEAWALIVRHEARAATPRHIIGDTGVQFPWQQNHRRSYRSGYDDSASRGAVAKSGSCVVVPPLRGRRGA